ARGQGAHRADDRAHAPTFPRSTSSAMLDPGYEPSRRRAARRAAPPAAAHGAHVRHTARSEARRCASRAASRRIVVVPPSPALVRERVRAWFAGAARDLPWRAPDRTPWGVLVSEVMLQQTPVVRVEPVWREWMVRWPG